MLREIPAEPRTIVLDITRFSSYAGSYCLFRDGIKTYQKILDIVVYYGAFDLKRQIQ